MSIISSKEKLFSKKFLIHGHDAKIASSVYDIYPLCIDNQNPSYLKIDGKYISTLLVINYNKEMEPVFLDKIIAMEADLQISIFYEKQNKGEVIKKLTYYIGNTSADIKTVNSNQSDVDIMKVTCEDAKYIRRQMQVDSEELYYIYIYIAISAETKEELEKTIQKVEGMAAGIGLTTRRGLFRQQEVFDACMPICRNPNNIKKLVRRNVLTSDLVSTYSFVSNELCDEEGILVGVNEINKSIVLVDRFDSTKYKNANMCVIGTSGSGKSYFTKLMAARNRYMNISQYIIDPEGEYLKLCKKLQRDHNKF